MNRQSGFTIGSVLSASAVSAVVATIIAPILSPPIQDRNRTIDVSRAKWVGQATLMYLEDFGERFPMSNSGGPTQIVQGYGFGPPDTVPLQHYTTMYLDGLEQSRMLKDPLTMEERIAEHLGVAPCDRSRYGGQCDSFAASVRTNFGYNYIFFSPWMIKRIGTIRYLTSHSLSASMVQNPAETITFGSSIWDRHPGTGAIRSGGNWVLETPCWLDANGGRLEPAKSLNLNNLFGGWQSPNNPPGSNSWIVYGGLWPFYDQVDRSSVQAGLKDGSFLIVMADGSAKFMNLGQITAGCGPYASGSAAGRVTDPSKFLWDLE